MSQVINLNKARKAKMRADKTAKAAENAVAFGRAKYEKKASAADRQKTNDTLDHHKLDR